MINLRAYPHDQPLRIILGAGEQRYPGWVATQREDLDLLDAAQWARQLGDRRVDALLCEHVWEHLTEAEGRAAAHLCFAYLRPGGYLRCAVPDGNVPNPEYQRTIRVGGPGPADHPAADHKVVYTHHLFADLFVGAGFVVDLLEYCDDRGRFHYHQWDAADGLIYRSLRFDHRNQQGALASVSIILDAIKPDGAGNVGTLWRGQ
jgi:predicted SAM-dependent methyltransferase